MLLVVWPGVGSGGLVIVGLMLIGVVWVLLVVGVGLLLIAFV